jgi:thiol-disulfide isomerase/thioredoxin
MSKPARAKRDNARERIAAQRAAARQAEIRNRIFITGGSVLLVIVVVVAFIVFKATRNSGSPAAAGSSASASSVTGTALPAAVLRDVATVPASTLNAVGAGSVPAVTSKPVTTINGAPLTAQGKPEMLYIGAEFCPYCAAMRWSMAVALSRFGAFSALRGIHSSPTDADPNTATLTFYKSSYSSPHLVFTPVENETVDKGPLQTPTPAQQQLWNRYDANSYPFIDVGGKYMITIIYNPAALAGKTWSQIASALHDPSSPIAQGADGAANYLLAAICKTTGNTPASACGLPVIKTLESKV